MTFQWVFSEVQTRREVELMSQRSLSKEIIVGLWLYVVGVAKIEPL